MNLTRSAKESISNAKKNFQRMGKQIKCVKSKISQKIFKNKLKKQSQNQADNNQTENYSYTSNSNEINTASSKVFEFEKFKSNFNFSRIEQKLNISGIVNGVKKKVLKLVQLDDCFEEDAVLYGFRSKVSLIQDQPCILGSTCKGSPDDPNLLDPNLESDASPKGLNKAERFDFDDSESENNFLEKQKLIDRQAGEEFSSDGPPECRVVRSAQCSTG